MTAMTTEQSRLFELLDAYARRHHHCFVTELFMNDQGTGYFVCFRPETPSKDSSSRFNCVYVVVELDRARDVTAKGELDSDLTGQINGKLSKLEHSATGDGTH